MFFTHLFVKSIFPVHVRFAVQLFGLGERRPRIHFLMVVVVRRPGVVPRVQAVLGALVETHLVQVEEHALRLKTDHGHGVVIGRLARVTGHSQFGLGHSVALEVHVLVRLPVVHQRIPSVAHHERLAVVMQRARRELAGRARQFETVPALHVQTAFAVRVDDGRVERREGNGHFQRIVFRHPQGTVSLGSRVYV